jgi:hypothetical protein
VAVTVGLDEHAHHLRHADIAGEHSDNFLDAYSFTKNDHFNKLLISMITSTNY